MTQARIVSGTPDIQLWVSHHNCKTHCKLCFMGKRRQGSSLEVTAEACAASTRLGFDTHIYTTDLASPDFPELAKLGDCITPNLQIETEELRDNQHPGDDPVGVSILSLDAAVHDSITRKGNHAKTLRALDELEERGIPFTAWVVVFEGNRAELPELLEFLLAKGAYEVFVNRLVRLGNAVELPDETFLDRAGIELVLKSLFGAMGAFRKRGLTITLQAAWGPLLTPFERGMYALVGPRARAPYCPGAHTSFGVEPDSLRVWACHFSMTLDALCLGSLDPELGLVLTEDWPFHPERIGEPCHSCELFEACKGGCRGMSIVDHFTRTGELDVYAGFAHCPVNLGLLLPPSWRSTVESRASFEEHGGMVPYH
jgi:radical SAM protein with 4Fe4S-binding SPASM domain